MQRRDPRRSHRIRPRVHIWRRYVFLPLLRSRCSYHPEGENNLTHLIDTYCGSGLFAISLYPHFKAIAGIELSQDSIHFAKHNAWINGLDSGRIRFDSSLSKTTSLVLNAPLDSKMATRSTYSQGSVNLGFNLHNPTDPRIRQMHNVTERSCILVCLFVCYINVCR